MSLFWCCSNWFESSWYGSIDYGVYLREGRSDLTLDLGTYQEYIVSPARYTSRIPDGVDDFSAGSIMCSGSTMSRAASGPFQFNRDTIR